MNADEMHKKLEEHEWHYDNGWRYQDKHWACYVRNDTVSVRILELLPKMIIVKNPGNNAGIEVWRGDVNTIDALEGVIERANAAIL